MTQWHSQLTQHDGFVSCQHISGCVRQPHVDQLAKGRRTELNFLDCTMRVELIGNFQPCMTEIYLHIDARMADYIRTHP